MKFGSIVGRLESIFLRSAIAYAHCAISHSLWRDGHRYSHFASPRLAGLVRAALLD